MLSVPGGEIECNLSDLFLGGLISQKGKPLFDVVDAEAVARTVALHHPVYFPVIVGKSHSG